MTNEEVYEIETILKGLSTSGVAGKKVQRLQELLYPLAEQRRIKDHKENMGIPWSWHNYDPLKQVQTSINTLSNAISFHQEAKIEEDKYELATQDILHAFELTNPTEQDLIDLGKQIVELRKQRRQTKNFIEIVEPLFNYAVKNRQVIKDLGRIHSDMMKIANTQENRTYYVREKTALQEAFEKAKKEA